MLDLLGLHSEQRYLLPFGDSVFDSSRVGRALFRTQESYFLVHPDYVTELTVNDDTLLFYPYRLHDLIRPALKNPDSTLLLRYSNELKANVQFLVNGLIENSLYK